MNNNKMQVLQQTSYLSGANMAYLEELYERYLSDASSVDSAWRAYFSALPSVGGAAEVSHVSIQEYF